MRDRDAEALERAKQELIAQGAKPLGGNQFTGYLSLDLGNGKTEIYEPQGKLYHLRNTIDTPKKQ